MFDRPVFSEITDILHVFAFIRFDYCLGCVDLPVTD